MQLTLSAIRGQVSRLLRDNGINSSQYDPARVLKAITFAQDEVAKRTGSSYAELNLNHSAGKVVLPTTLISLVRAYLSDGATVKLLHKTSIDFEDSKDASWRVAVGSPTLWMDFSGNTIRLNKIPSGSGTVIIGFIERPTAMVAESDIPDARIPDHYHQFLKYAAAAFLLNQAGSTEDIAKADKFMDQFNALIGAGAIKVASTEVDR